MIPPGTSEARYIPIWAGMRGSNESHSPVVPDENFNLIFLPWSWNGN